MKRFAVLAACCALLPAGVFAIDPEALSAMDRDAFLTEMARVDHAYHESQGLLLTRIQPEMAELVETAGGPRSMEANVCLYEESVAFDMLPDLAVWVAVHDDVAAFIKADATIDHARLVREPSLLLQSTDLTLGMDAQMNIGTWEARCTPAVIGPPKSARRKIKNAIFRIQKSAENALQ